MLTIINLPECVRDYNKDMDDLHGCAQNTFQGGQGGVQTLLTPRGPPLSCPRIRAFKSGLRWLGCGCLAEFGMNSKPSWISKKLFTDLAQNLFGSCLQPGLGFSLKAKLKLLNWKKTKYSGFWKPNMSCIFFVHLCYSQTMDQVMPIIGTIV